jgi:hypothetical protein
MSPLGFSVPLPDEAQSPRPCLPFPALVRLDLRGKGVRT